jgi:hypothetical protein
MDPMGRGGDLLMDLNGWQLLRQGRPVVMRSHLSLPFAFFLTMAGSPCSFFTWFFRVITNNYTMFAKWRGWLIR